MVKRDAELDAVIKKIKADPKAIMTLDEEQLEILTTYLRQIKDDLKGNGGKV